LFEVAVELLVDDVDCVSSSCSNTASRRINGSSCFNNKKYDFLNEKKLDFVK
jgi:hypothetical protein